MTSFIVHKGYKGLEIIRGQSEVHLTILTKVAKVGQKLTRRKGQSPFYSAPSIFAVFRNLVQVKWFCKLGFFFWFEKSGWPEKKIQVCRTTFLEPLFYTFLEKWLQIKWPTAQLEILFIFSVLITERLIDGNYEFTVV